MRDWTWAPGSVHVLRYLLDSNGPAISAEARLVYLKLFAHMGADFTCWPSIPAMAQGTGLSERTVRRRMDELEGAGYIQRIRRSGEATVYTMFPPWAPAVQVRETPEPEPHPEPLSDRHPCQPDTPVRVTGVPLSDSHPCQSDRGTPVRLTGDPCHSDSPPLSDRQGTPVRLTGEVSQEVSQRSNSMINDSYTDTETRAHASELPAAPEKPALEDDLVRIAVIEACYIQEAGRFPSGAERLTFQRWLQDADGKTEPITKAMRFAWDKYRLDAEAAGKTLNRLPGANWLENWVQSEISRHRSQEVIANEPYAGVAGRSGRPGRKATGAWPQSGRHPPRRADEVGRGAGGRARYSAYSE